MLRVIILGYLRQLFPQLLFITSFLLQLYLMLHDRHHGLRDLVVFVTQLRLRFVQRTWKQDLQFMMVSELAFQRNLSSASAPTIPWKQQAHQEIGCACQRGRGRVIVQCDFVSRSAVRALHLLYADPCGNFRSEAVFTEITHWNVSLTFPCSISNLMCLSLGPFDSWTLLSHEAGSPDKLC